jgi:hypothetical protein
VVEAGWGEVFTRQDPVILQALGSATLHEIAEKTMRH